MMGIYSILYDLLALGVIIFIAFATYKIYIISRSDVEGVSGVS